MQIPMDLGLAQQRQKARLIATGDGSFTFIEGAGAGAHLIELRHADLARAALRLRLELRPAEGGEGGAAFCILRPNQQDLVRVGQDGALHVPADADVLEATCQAGASGWMQLDIRFRNFPPQLVFALAKPGPRYDGGGKAQFMLRNLTVEALEPRWTPSPLDGLVTLECGATTRLDPAWAAHQGSLRTILCEPDEAVGRAVLAALPAGEHILLPNALSNRNGAGKYNITRQPAMNSALEPDARRVKPFANAAGFEVKSSSKVQLTRFDSLSRQLHLPQPDLLRIRAGGAEFDVLRGCGDLLDHILAVEVQAHFYPLYRKQKLIGDIIDLLDGYGFALRRLQPQAAAATAHEMVAATAYFSRRKAEGAALGKLAFIEEIWGVSFPR